MQHILNSTKNVIWQEPTRNAFRGRDDNTPDLHVCSGTASPPRQINVWRSVGSPLVYVRKSSVPNAELRDSSFRGRWPCSTKQLRGRKPRRIRKLGKGKNDLSGTLTTRSHHLAGWGVTGLGICLVFASIRLFVQKHHLFSSSSV